MEDVKLGMTVRDTITGFTGLVIGRTEYIHSTTLFCVQPRHCKDGKPVEAVWFESSRLELNDE